MEKTLGSLFDGIGGFPLAGSYSGFDSLWASEIEPFPIRVTKKRFPQMKHLGDITKINGAEIEPTAVICGGSPCQDLSVAGLRAGMAQKCSQCGKEFDITDEITHCPVCGAEIEKTRSGLFMEQIRIVKEMRSADAKRGRTGKSIRPQFMVWENVPGAFSSHSGEDFKIVLEETCRIIDGSVHISRPSEGWPTVGAIVGKGFSLAWRVLDAQYWGVPQRRRRIFLVADFAGFSAPKILFKRESVSGNSTPCGASGQGPSTDVEGSAQTAGFNGWRSVTGNIEYAEERAPCLNTQMAPNAVIKCEPQIARTLTARADSSPCVDRGQNIVVIPINDKATRFSGGGPTRHEDGAGNGLGIGKPGDPAPTLSCGDRHAVAVSAGFNGKAEAKAGNIGYEEEISPTLKAEQPSHVVCYDMIPKVAATLTSKMSKGTGGPSGDECQNLVCTPKAYTQRKFGEYESGVGTLLSGNTSGKTGETLITAPNCHSREKTVFGLDSEQNAMVERVGTIRAHCSGGAENNVYTGYCVRRLTPLECERLQGYPDRWTDIPRASDSARYKALGNSVAVPCVAYIMRGIAEELDRAA